jgi:hypothetical protein
MNKPKSTLATPPVFAALALGFACVAVAAPGCTDKGKSGAAPNAPQPVAAPTAVPKDMNATRLKSGPAPFTYLVGGGGNVRVVDATAGKTLVTATAAPNAIVSVDDAKGVSVANKVVKPGPLPAGHKYELWLDTKK